MIQQLMYDEEIVPEHFLLLFCLGKHMFARFVGYTANILDWGPGSSFTKLRNPFLRAFHIPNTYFVMAVKCKLS